MGLSRIQSGQVIHGDGAGVGIPGGLALLSVHLHHRGSQGHAVGLNGIRELNGTGGSLLGADGHPIGQLAVIDIAVRRFTGGNIVFLRFSAGICNLIPIDDQLVVHAAQYNSSVLLNLGGIQRAVKIHEARHIVLGLVDIRQNHRQPINAVHLFKSVSTSVILQGMLPIQQALRNLDSLRVIIGVGGGVTECRTGYPEIDVDCRLEFVHRRIIAGLWGRSRRNLHIGQRLRALRKKSQCLFLYRKRFLGRRDL